MLFCLSSFYCYVDLRNLHSFPTRRSSDLEVRTAANASSSRLVLFGEHARLLISDGKEMHTFAVSPEQIYYAAAGAKEDKERSEERRVGKECRSRWAAED